MLPALTNRVRQQSSLSSGLQQLFAEVTDRLEMIDLEAQFNLTAGRHNVVAGGGVRTTKDEFINDANFFKLDPESRRLWLANLFVQDEFALTDRLSLSRDRWDRCSAGPCARVEPVSLPSQRERHAAACDPVRGEAAGDPSDEHRPQRDTRNGRRGGGDRRLNTEIQREVPVERAAGRCPHRQTDDHRNGSDGERVPSNRRRELAR